MPVPARAAVSFERIHSPPASPIPPDPCTIPARPSSVVHGGCLAPPSVLKQRTMPTGEAPFHPPPAQIPAQQTRMSPIALPQAQQVPGMSTSTSMQGLCNLPASALSRPGTPCREAWLSHSGPLPTASSMADPCFPQQQQRPYTPNAPSLSRHRVQSKRFACSSHAFPSFASRQSCLDDPGDRQTESPHAEDQASSK